MSEKNSDVSSLREDPKCRQASESSATTETSSAQVHASLASQLLGLEKHYRIGQKLGQGSYGSVYSAVHVQSGKAFALKTVLKRQGTGGEDIEVEFASSSMLDYPYIVKLHAFFREDGKYHLVMDLCTGGDLMTTVTDYVRTARKANPRYNSGLAPQAARRYAWQMLDGLEFVHRSGLIHRDIKPENYLLQDDRPNSPLKLADFGLACHIGPGEKLSRPVGSAYYVAPELLSGSYDQAADVWSLGVTCFWMCTNMLPFGGFDEEEYLQSVRAGAIEQYDCTWSQHALSMRATVLQMLTRNPEARPSAKRLLAGSARPKAYDRRAGVDGCCVVA